ncbi:hypothetical protein CDL12_10117 [Handroanthus impetiginosus]|uniref:DUF4005 domain-containing protein n=1 Tax=Handroanthus impetiginosus TaxID=429701 RepID=A0A2G9HIB7_9LAMI|nr:hypothetical protein CDL12_10117 [Handroanthus impetiginosus]
MGRRWGLIRTKLFRSSIHLPSHHHHHHDKNAIFVLHTNNGSYSQEFTSTASGDHQNVAGLEEFQYSREGVAAITIQAYFRAHLAKRAYRALRSLVKLQALVRGVVVRRQARIALHCMQAMARLQITVQARQLLNN